MNVYTLHEELTKLYPKTLSAPWDNDGVMSSSDMYAEVRRVVVALDASYPVIKYAAEHGYDTIVVHHPMIFKPAKSVTTATFTGRRIIESLTHGISILSLHTRLDAADGGVNDELCRVLGFTASEKFGDDETPTLARIVEIPGMTAADLAALVKSRLGCDAIRVSGDLSKTITRIALCGGDGKDFVFSALSHGCDAYITGDAGYNIAADAAEEGLVTIEAGHYHTEAPVCRVLAENIKKLTGITAEFYHSCGYKIL